jgi:hypothetical protein
VPSGGEATQVSGDRLDQLAVLAAHGPRAIAAGTSASRSLSAIASNIFKATTPARSETAREGLIPASSKRLASRLPHDREEKLLEARYKYRLLDPPASI